MIAQWENESHCLSSVARVFQGIFPWLITRAALYTGVRRPKARVTGETVAKIGVAPP